ncbi:MAG: type VI secretion system baseplate subunit TssF [Acidobacteria bacterium]|nr:type VI secretion system baseplate subunit TssF [Acidobacteriota bacterium]
MVSRDDRIYYEEELRYLAREGQVFAERHPDIARYLGLEGLNPELRDPHSERIIEAFAFLVGRMRRFMNHQFSDLLHSLFNLIYPAYLRPLPSKSIVQLSPQESMLDKPVTIPRGTSVSSDAVGPNGARFEFTTTHQVVVQPLALDRVYVDPETKADFSLSAELTVHPGAQAKSLVFDELEFFVFGDPSESFELYNQLSRFLERIELKGTVTRKEDLLLEWSGFNADHSLNQTEDHHFSQLNHLRDYFDFPQRYLFFKIKGLAPYLQRQGDDLTKFQVNFIFKRPFTSGYQYRKDSLRLFCVPVQNIFSKPCEPFKVTGRQIEYLLSPDLTRNDFEVSSVDRVLASKEQKKVQVQPYYNFTHVGVKSEKRWFYTLRRENAFDQGWDTYIRFLDLDEESPDVLRDQTISINARCTNRHHAQTLKIGQISQLSQTVPETITGKNITQVTKAYWPEIHTRGDWDFMSHMALNFTDLANTEGVRRLLELYNIPQNEAGKRKITGIDKVSDAKDHLIMLGQSVAGRKLEMHCKEAYFQHDGDLALFSQVFGHFLRAYTPINSFIRLIIHNSDQSEQFQHIAAY